MFHKKGSKKEKDKKKQNNTKKKKETKAPKTTKCRLHKRKTFYTYMCGIDWKCRTAQTSYGGKIQTSKKKKKEHQ